MDSLRTNHCYYIEFYVNLYNNAKYGNNNISLLLTDTAIWADFKYKTPTANGLIPANPQIQLNGNPVIIDTLNWIKISGIYTAHGGEQYITIGNFKDDAHTDTLNINNNGVKPTAYYIDDVSVISLDSMFLKADAGRDTTIVKGDSLWIGSRVCGLQNVVWYDAGGNVIDTGVPGLWVKPKVNTFYVIEQNVCGQYSRDTVNVMVAPMPVVLLSFNVSGFKSFNGNTNTEVSWVTSTEINTAYFNVQRSTDGINFWTIGKVIAKGASSYRYIDNTNLTGVIYYRLEIVDKNGALSYSEIREIDLSSSNNEISIYPNPAKDVVTINGNNIKQVIISDISGRVLITTKEKRIDIRGLQSGTYIIQIETINGNYVTQKFVRLF